MLYVNKVLCTILNRKMEKWFEIPNTFHQRLSSFVCFRRQWSLGAEVSVCRKCWTLLGNVADQQRYIDLQEKLCVHLNNAEFWLRVRRRLRQTDDLGRRSQGTNGSLLAWKNPRKHHQLCTPQVFNFQKYPQNRAQGGFISYSLAKIRTKI